MRLLFDENIEIRTKFWIVENWRSRVAANFGDKNHFEVFCGNSHARQSEASQVIIISQRFLIFPLCVSVGKINFCLLIFFCFCFEFESLTNHFKTLLPPVSSRSQDGPNGFDKRLTNQCYQNTLQRKRNKFINLRNFTARSLKTQGVGYCLACVTINTTATVKFEKLFHPPVWWLVWIKFQLCYLQNFF